MISFCIKQKYESSHLKFVSFYTQKTEAISFLTRSFLFYNIYLLKLIYIMNRKNLIFAFLISSFLSYSQITFTNSNTSLVNSSLTSGVAIGVSDMNADGLDDIVRLSNANSLEIEYQTASGTFTRYNYGSIGSSAWGLCIADVDHNGFNDIFTGGSYNGLKLITANNNGTAYTSNTLGGASIFVQNLNFIDIDNNGMIDIFACHDDGISSPYKNTNNGTLTYDLSLINSASTVPSDNSGNYGSIWTDYDNDGDQDLYISKCRLGVTDNMDGRRLNLLLQNDGNGNYTDVAETAGLRPLAQSWAANFEDIDNDGDLDCFILNHDIISTLYENNGDGTFTDITSSSGIVTELTNLGTSIQVMMEDFDNDTYIDMLVTVTTGSSNHYLFKNNGDKTFTALANPFPTGGLVIQSGATGDLNNDGLIDVVAGFAGGFNSPSSNPDILFLNNGDGNNYNWSEVRLQGGPSNRNGIGARIELHYGTGLMQIREVRSGESYGTMNSLLTHFGLGAETTITKIVVKWPSGNVDQLLNPAINQSLLIIEGTTLGTSEFNTVEFVTYPNPTTDIVTIKNITEVNTKSTKLYDITGKEIEVLFTKVNGTIKTDLSNLNSGIYFIHIRTDKGIRHIHKIIKK
jgi:hypothetical protein